MATFVYKARTRSGEKVEGSVDAADRRAALVEIENLGQTPVSVVEKSEASKQAAAGRPRSIGWGRRAKMSSRDILIFTTELSDLLASGMTLGHALNCLAGRKTGKAGDVIIAQLRDEIIHGSSLSDALAQHPKTFPNIYVSMIRAGEAGGALHETLKRLVTHFERMQETKEKVIMALVYPSIVLVMGIITVVFTMIWVVPKFKMVFEQIDQTLPAPTRFLIGCSEWMGSYKGIILLAVLVIAGSLAKEATKTRKGKLWWDGILLKTPLIRGVVAAGIYASFARTLATLLSNGVPILQALGIVERIVGNTVVSREIHNARERVTDGTTISGPLAAGKVFPPMMTDMLAVGEQTGDVGGALLHIARRYENELDRNLKIVTTALEPILIVLVALVVGFIAISVLLAVFELTSGLSV